MHTSARVTNSDSWIVDEVAVDDFLGTLPVLHCSAESAANDNTAAAPAPFNRIKRGIDIVGSATLLLLTSPLMLMVALLIRLESRGPIFFSQTRCGLGGRHFRFWKFRSMVVDAEYCRASLVSQERLSGGVRFKMADDPRITRVGRIIRKFSIDELPQFWNVLVGDMSLVGPRPPIPSEVDCYSVYEHQRLSIIPGITCTWQIAGRSEIPFTEQVEMDLEYIRTHSLLGDLMILLKTPLAVITARGAC